MANLQTFITQILNLEGLHRGSIFRSKVGQGILMQEGCMTGIPALFKPHSPTCRHIKAAPVWTFRQLLRNKRILSKCLFFTTSMRPHKQQAFLDLGGVGSQLTALLPQQSGFGFLIPFGHGDFAARAIALEAPAMETTHQLAIGVHPAMCQRGQAVWTNATVAPPLSIAIFPKHQILVKQLDGFRPRSLQHGKWQHRIPLLLPVEAGLGFWSPCHLALPLNPCHHRLAAAAGYPHCSQETHSTGRPAAPSARG
mmetsp:Transcript_72248/g.146176  ORF Transcript_72248/g.146176 Transcript_72248/m.146176 type:complete len:253 (-) Transcript_72248:6-764(-)